ncbi:Ectin [Acropora cervicornis]|uniref:Ectin n=1 Tax=Acropora cervicornis TaxID=6130 RepID=A0AAD9R784_ACRCE|nr:Ectin [Acropora cervicornis]
MPQESVKKRMEKLRSTDMMQTSFSICILSFYLLSFCHGAPLPAFLRSVLSGNGMKEESRVLKRSAPVMQDEIPVCAQNQTDRYSSSSRLCRLVKDLGFCEFNDLYQTVLQSCPIGCGFCRVEDGNWSVWGAWSPCSATCGDGQRSRSRSCTNPPPSGGGADCVGASQEIEGCNRRSCEGIGGWSNWGQWSACSESCNIGIQARTRTCTNPPPTIPEGGCEGSAFETQICSTSGQSPSVVTRTIAYHNKATINNRSKTALSSKLTLVIGVNKTTEVSASVSTAAATTSPVSRTTQTQIGPTVVSLTAKQQACLDAHNAKRAIHGSPPLEWDFTLAMNADEWANQLAVTRQLEHDPNIMNEGENLFKSAGALECVDAVERWFLEGKDYDYEDDNKLDDDTSNFTQLVWRNTTRVGVATVVEVVSGGSLETYIVARYTPPGNIEGQFEENPYEVISKAE